MSLFKQEKRISQKQKVIMQLEEYGEVNNYWAIHNYILRLGAIIFTLRDEGWKIKGDFSKTEKKNYVYTLEKKI